MRFPKPVTPAEAMAVWNTIKNPSDRRVARALSQTGREVHHSTIARRYARGWRPVAHEPHRLEGARQALDLAAGVLTGDPVGGMKNLGYRRMAKFVQDNEQRIGDDEFRESFTIFGRQVLERRLIAEVAAVLILD
jgi:hypothetical protein